jgi:hypothetical protein
LADALLKLEEGSDLTADEGRLISQAVDSLIPTEVEEQAEDNTDQAMLELKKLKLQKLLNRI